MDISFSTPQKQEKQLAIPLAPQRVRDLRRNCSLGGFSISSVGSSSPIITKPKGIKRILFFGDEEPSSLDGDYYSQEIASERSFNYGIKSGSPLFSKRIYKEKEG